MIKITSSNKGNHHTHEPDMRPGTPKSHRPKPFADWSPLAKVSAIVLTLGIVGAIAAQLLK